MTGTVADMLVAVAQEHGDREAIVDGSVRLSYAALVRRAAAAAKGLGDLGVVPGDRVAILLPNSWEHVVAYLGVHFAGAVAVLVNTRFTVPEIEHVLADSGSRIVLTDAACRPWVAGGTVGDLHKSRGSQPHLRGTGRNSATGTHRTGPCRPNATKRVKSGEAELCVRGPVVTAGYWANPEATAATYVDGWLHTGDVGSIDADGYVRVLDRLKDMIIRGGENIYSLEVETAIATHPDVAEVAVVGVPDPIFDERVRAVVVPRPGSTPTVGSVQEHAAALLADYKVPVEVHFAAELPRNPSGKVLKRRLAEERDDVAR